MRALRTELHSEDPRKPGPGELLQERSCQMKAPCVTAAADILWPALLSNDEPGTQGAVPRLGSGHSAGAAAEELSHINKLPPGRS